MVTCSFLKSDMEPLRGQLLYRDSDRNFDFEPDSREEVWQRAGGDGGTTSLLYGTIQIEVGIVSGAILYVWGFEDRSEWQKHRSRGGAIVNKGLRVICRPELEMYVSQRLTEMDETRTFVDTDEGVVVVERTPTIEVDYYARVCTGTVLGIGRGETQIARICLWPQFVDE